MQDGTALKSILLLAANPKETVNLRLQEEEREIKEQLRLAGYGKVPINSAGAARPRDIQQAMVDFKPQIVHFSSHGVGQDGLVFEDSSGKSKLVSSEALADLFKLFCDHVECIVLNACYSEFQAKAIAQSIKYVIGMSKTIGDPAAIEFAVGFYKALGAGESIEFSYKLGCNAIQLAGITQHQIPILYIDGSIIDGSISKPKDGILVQADFTNEKSSQEIGLEEIILQADLTELILIYEKVRPCLIEKVEESSLEDLVCAIADQEGLTNELIEQGLASKFGNFSFDELIEIRQGHILSFLPRKNRENMHRYFTNALRQNISKVVDKFVKSGSYRDAEFNADLLAEVSDSLSPAQWEVILRGFCENSQIYDAYGCPGTFRSLFEKSIGQNEDVPTYWLSFREKLDKFSDDDSDRSERLDHLKCLIDSKIIASAEVHVDGLAE